MTTNQLPPLPKPFVPGDEHNPRDYFVADQMHAYALAALAQQAKPEPPVPTLRTDGWLQSGGLLYRLTDDRRPHNRDEINVTMADGSCSEESRTRRAGELLDRIRSAPPVPAPVDEREAFKVELANMPEWAPEFECHRAWVEHLLWTFWQARAALQSTAPQATKGQP